MDKLRQKRLDFLIDALYIAAICGIIYFLCRYLFGWLLPLIVGYCIALLARPVVARLSGKNPNQARIVGGAVLVASYILILAGLAVLGVMLFDWIQELLTKLPKLYHETLLPTAREIDQLFSKISPKLAGSTLLQEAISWLQDALLSLLAHILSRLGTFGAQLPNFFITCVFSVICSVLISVGYRDITNFVLRNTPKGWHDILLSLRRETGTVMHDWILREFILLFLTFCELAIGLWLLGVPSWLLCAAMISLFDLLPLLGTGGVLLPWAVVMFLQGNLAMAAGLCILWAIIISIHGILELRMTGIQFKLHPLAGICAAYLGLKLLGGWGMIIFPTALGLLVTLHRAGHICTHR